MFGVLGSIFGFAFMMIGCFYPARLREEIVAARILMILGGIGFLLGLLIVWIEG